MATLAGHFIHRIRLAAKCNRQHAMAIMHEACVGVTSVLQRLIWHMRRQ